MNQSISVKPKRGRPATGRDPLVGVRLPRDLIERVDGWADTRELTRSEAIRRLLESGLKVKGPE